MTPLNTTLTIVSVELQKTKRLTPAGKEYLCLQINNISYRASHCVKSRILNKAIGYILYIEKFEQQYVVIKCMLKSPRLEDHIKTIGIDQSLCNMSSFEHKCLNLHEGKCDDKKN